MSAPTPIPSEENPLRSSDGKRWDWLIESVGPASMLVVIERRMSDDLRRHYTDEDVWQETLLQAWRDRAQCEWRGLRPFRRWLLTIAENVLRALSDRTRAQKRGGGTTEVGARDSEFAGPILSTTPSRAASDAERARRIRAALDTLPEELRPVLYLRLFEERTFEEIAEQLGATVSGVRHRFLRGFERYHDALLETLRRPTGGNAAG